MNELFKFKNIKIVFLEELINEKSIELGRGNVISKIDIRNNPGMYPIYSSSANNEGKMGQYSKFMFNEELITWSVDGGGNFFYKKKHKFSVTNVCGYMRANKEEFDIKFLHEILSYQHKYLNFDYQFKAHPSVIRKLYKIPKLSLLEQKKISSVLKSFDDLIDKYDDKIRKLGFLKKSILKKLFKEGTNNNEFKNTELGKLPKNWECKKISEVAKLERGKFTHRPRNDPSYYNGKYPFIQTGDIPKEFYEISKYKQTLNEKGLNVSKVFPSGTLVLTIAANIGEVGILKFDSCFPDSLVGISVDEKKADKMYILFMMKNLKKKLEQLSPESAQKNINLDILQNLIIPVPKLKEQQEISSIIKNIFNQTYLLNKKKIKLIDLKKSVSSDILSGKINISLN